ncbi:MAG: ATP-dependent DNA helicase DinG [Xanthomonadales bacterium]|nr:ATP-dependent DNA helicase DinG [Xanthomonadales bacterium]
MLEQAAKDALRAAYAQIQAGLPGFRPRAAQRRMIAEVAKIFGEAGAVAVIEAPTGTGKSMAYLLAGVALSRAQHKRLLIATATVALQEQLLRNDIPQYLALTDDTAAVALAKGRGRYLCPRNLALALRGLDAGEQLGLTGFEAETALWTKPPSAAERQSLEQLATAFAERSWYGDLDAAPAPVSDLLRPMVTTSAGGCSGRKCAYFAQCPFFTARRSLDDAEIIVANHDLVLADLTMSGEPDRPGGVILPPPGDTLYVFDEAHRLPGKAIARGTSEVQLAAAARQLERLGRLAQAAYAFAGKASLGGMDVAQGTEKLEQLGQALELLDTAIRRDWVPDPDDGTAVYRGSLGCLPEPWLEQARALGMVTTEMQRWLAAVRRGVLEAPEGGPLQESLAGDLGLAMERLARHAACWEAWGGPDAKDEPPLARWATLNAERQLTCHASAVSAAGLLRSVLWGHAGGVLLTSATLSAGGDFHSYADAVGLPGEALTLSLPSPFDLDRQARLEVPAMRHLPDAREAHADEIGDWLAEHLDWDTGNLVLFTSRAKLQRVLQRLPIAQVRRVRAQGSLPKADLLAAHGEDIAAGKGSTVFGLASFGEGLDLPGKLCETVVITQLPFAVPTDPVGATYAEWLEAHGRNPLLEVSVPEATRLLIQYCGRLIRNESDQGRIVLLDRRVVTRRYGSVILRALPPFRRVIERGPASA